MTLPAGNWGEEYYPICHFYYILLEEEARTELGLHHLGNKVLGEWIIGIREEGKLWHGDQRDWKRER